MGQRWEMELSFCTVNLSVLSEFSNHVYVLLLFYKMPIWLVELLTILERVI